MPNSVLFGRYELLETAGRGGSAEVWRARDRETGEIVAVKRLHPIAFADATARRRLEREFRMLQTLDEPHVVRVRELRIEDREAALILDYVEGESLAGRLAGVAAAGDRLPLGAAVAIVADIAAALGAAHAAGLVHRDVTPANILLGRDGQAHLTDFGIAHATGDGTATAVTATGLVLGTMRYLAPEQLRGEPATPASDLHALAAVAYEMAAGQPAYEAATPVALVEAQRAGPAPIEDVPAAVDAVIRRGLDPDPARRPSDLRTFAAELTAALPAGGADQATVAIQLPTSIRHPVDDVAVASPARAAAAVGPVLAWTGERLEGDDVSIRRRVPGPVVAGVGLAVAIIVLAAASGIDQLPRAGTAAEASVRPTEASTPTPRVTDRPKPKPNEDGDRGGGGGKDHGKGHD
jgi:serine/threonine-protein kinase